MFGGNKSYFTSLPLSVFFSLSSVCGYIYCSPMGFPSTPPIHSNNINIIIINTANLEGMKAEHTGSKERNSSVTLQSGITTTLFVG